MRPWLLGLRFAVLAGRQSSDGERLDLECIALADFQKPVVQASSHASILSSSGLLFLVEIVVTAASC